jgi:hypothetical protein
VIGGVTSTFYLLKINEVFLSAKAKEYDYKYKQKTKGILLKDSGILEEEDLPTVPKLTLTTEKLKDWKGWLTEGQFYLHGVVYMMVRIAVNVTMVKYIIFFID